MRASVQNFSHTRNKMRKYRTSVTGQSMNKRGVSHPPEKKSFSAIKYMQTSIIENFLLQNIVKASSIFLVALSISQNFAIRGRVGFF